MDRLNELFGVDTSESTSNQADYSELTLSQKLDHLLELEIIRKKKYDNYFEKINDKTTAPGLLRYFEKQFDLLHRLYVLAGLNKMSDDTRATIYKRIMSSKMKDFTEIDNELKTMEAA
jgi:prenyltransferase beta subunit